jgi:hypothetical protein
MMAMTMRRLQRSMTRSMFRCKTRDVHNKSNVSKIINKPSITLFHNITTSFNSPKKRATPHHPNFLLGLSDSTTLARSIESTKEGDIRRSLEAATAVMDVRVRRSDRFMVELICGALVLLQLVVAGWVGFTFHAALDMVMLYLKFKTPKT